MNTKVNDKPMSQKIIPVIVSIFLLSVLVIFMPTQEAFAEIGIDVSLDNTSYIVGDDIIVSGDLTGQFRNEPTVFQLVISKDNNTKWSDFVSGSFNFTVNTSGWESGDYKLEASDKNKTTINFEILQKNFADITYNPNTHDALVTWDFGNRGTCYSKTDVGINYINNNTVNYNTLTQSDNVTFFGTDFSPVYNGISESQIVNEPLTIISCSGNFTFNISNFQVLENFDGFEFWTSFYTVIDDKPQILNEVGLVYSETTAGKLYKCNENTPDLYTDYYYNNSTAQKIVGTGQCVTTDEEWIGVIPYDHTPVDTISYPDPDNPIVIQQEKKKSGSGCSGDCVEPTLGLNKNFKRVVDYGFSYNGNKVQVDKWYTEFPLINANNKIPIPR